MRNIEKPQSEFIRTFVSVLNIYQKTNQISDDRQALEISFCNFQKESMPRYFIYSSIHKILPISEYPLSSPA